MHTTVRFRSLLAALAMCAAAAVCVESHVDRTWHAVSRAAVRAWRWVVDLVLSPLATAAQALVKALPGPAVALIAAKLYLMRQIKREKPQLAPSWRMCPSS